MTCSQSGGLIFQTAHCVGVVSSEEGQTMMKERRGKMMHQHGHLLFAVRFSNDVLKWCIRIGRLPWGLCSLGTRPYDWGNGYEPYRLYHGTYTVPYDRPTVSLAFRRGRCSHRSIRKQNEDKRSIWGRCMSTFRVFLFSRCWSQRDRRKIAASICHLVKLCTLLLMLSVLKNDDVHHSLERFELWIKFRTLTDPLALSWRSRC